MKFKSNVNSRLIPTEQDLDRLTSPFHPEYFTELGATLNLFVPSTVRSDQRHVEITYDFKFYLPDSPEKEGSFRLSTSRDADTLMSKSRFKERIRIEISKVA